MAIGDVEAVEDVPDVHYVDTGMYDTEGYGAVYVIDAERPALVETGIGVDRERVLAAIEAVGLAPADVEVIAVTHVHLDHAGGAGFLTAACPNAEVVVHERGAPHVVAPNRLVAGTKSVVADQWRHYAEPEPVPEARVRSITDGDRIDLGDRELVASHAPGHAPHQVVYASPDDDAVFAADAAGLLVPARDALFPTTPPPQFDYPQVLADLTTIARIDPETLLYAHFGPADAEGRLAAYARVLAGWVTDVAEARAAERATDAGEGGDVAPDADGAVVDRFVTDTDLDAVWGAEKARAEVAMNVRGVLGYLADRDGHADG